MRGAGRAGRSPNVCTRNPTGNETVFDDGGVAVFQQQAYWQLFLCVETGDGTEGSGRFHTLYNCFSCRLSKKQLLFEKAAQLVVLDDYV